MKVRPIAEEDIQSVINLFRENYGNDYSMPEFYDPNWVKRGVYSDHIIWLVIEDDDGKIVASGACILNFGDYNDLIGEIGRVVVDPDTSGKGLGRMILESIVDAADQRVEFTFAEARTVHPKTQKINDHIGLVPLGFLPLHYKMKWRESLVLAGQLFGNGRTLRRVGQAEVVPAVAPLAQLSLKNLELDEPINVRDNVRGYPLDQPFDIQPLTASSLLRVIKIEQGRLIEPEIFSGMHIDEGMSQLAARKANYVVAVDGDRVLGALGYLYNERHESVRLIELIGQDDNVKGALLNWAVNHAQDQYEAQVIEADVSAYNPRLQQTLLTMGFLPTGYVPGMVFHHTARYDVVKFAKLNTPWELGPFELTPKAREYFELVAPPFERAAKEHERRLRELNSPALKGITPLETYLLNHAGAVSELESGGELEPNALYIILGGAVKNGDRVIGKGGVVGAKIAFGGADDTGAAAIEPTRVFTLTKSQLDTLCQAHPRLGIKLYQNLATLGTG
ncbi:MAG TPA: GNAT family N-acetyltransferase [Anaerolineae bacterium]|nr:GNAT family N-acetyltransferase [Anaerolineae bacterium]